MKKIFTMILFAAGTISFAAAQSYNHKASGYTDDKKISNNRDIPVAYNKNTDYNKQDRYQPVQTKDNWQNKDQHQTNDLAYGRKDDHDRQADFDRMNKQYDQKINDYRNDRSMSRFDRDRKIREAEQERQQQSKGFGKGLAFGGIAGVLFGAIMNH
jgi:hypothetical protein